MSFSDPVYILLHLAAFAFLISLAFSGFMISAGLMDKPVGRSNHSTQVPTAGGVGIIAGFGAALVALTLFYPLFADQGLLGTLSALVLAVAFLGLTDDLYNLRPLLKFFVMVVIAAAAVMVIGEPQVLPFSVVDITLTPLIGIAGAILWIFVTMNGVNFMDGSNGLMAGFMTIAFAVLAMIAFLANATTTAVVTVCMMAALLGFMPYNWRNKAHLFAGDVGALTVGFTFGICSLLLVAETGNGGLLYVGPVIILPFLTDILLTMLMRARKKENLLAAHSSHSYQRLIRAGHSHVKVAVCYMLSAVVAGLIAYIGFRSGMIRSVYFLVLQAALWAGVFLYLYTKYPNVSDQQQKQPNP